jgi:hypothetical protein
MLYCTDCFHPYLAVPHCTAVSPPLLYCTVLYRVRERTGNETKRGQAGRRDCLVYSQHTTHTTHNIQHTQHTTHSRNTHNTLTQYTQHTATQQHNIMQHTTYHTNFNIDSKMTESILNLFTEETNCFFIRS